MIYRVKLDDDSEFLMDCDMVQAAAPICAKFWLDEEGSWQPTPFQTASARHDENRAAKLCNDYFRAADDDSQVVSVEATYDHEIGDEVEFTSQRPCRLDRRRYAKDKKVTITLARGWNEDDGKGEGGPWGRGGYTSRFVASLERSR